MSRTIRAITGTVLILIIFFCAINICQNIGRAFLKIDVTERKVYTLSKGTKAILARLNQPVSLRLYYAKTASMKGPDQIRFFNKYYEFVQSLLKEYETASSGMVRLQIIDPRPFSDDEAQALKYGLKRFPITEEENFFFGLVLQTQFGVEKAIPFFSPDRQNFIEYDISYLIDTAITRKKSKIGIISSLPVTGDDVTGYMAQMMRMQGQQPKPAWTFVEQLRSQFEVNKIEPDIKRITDTDFLLVIHPKSLPEKVLFAIDQFVLEGGRTIVFVDPHCIADQPDMSQIQMGAMPVQKSDLNKLLNAWGLNMPADKFAGDRTLALTASLGPDERPAKVIGLLELNPAGKCFNTAKAITANLNQVRVLFSGVLEQIKDQDKFKEINYIPLISTSSRGNVWRVDSPYELMYPDPAGLMKKFTEGTEPVNMGYIVSGKLKTAFPDGIEVETESKAPESENGDKAKDNQTEKKMEKITGLNESSGNSALAVFADVDLISDMLAYQNSFFGKIVVGDNSALLLNTIEDLSGSADLLSIRSRGSFERPFVRVDEIEQQAEKRTAAEEDKINAQINGFQKELQEVLASAKGDQQEVIGSTILQKKKDLELKLHEAQRGLRDVKMKRRQEIEALGAKLRIFNMLAAPLVILMIAVFLSIRHSLKKRYYISHASDA